MTSQPAALLRSDSVNSTAMQNRFQLAQILWQRGGPAHAFAGLRGMFECQYFGVQGLPVKGNEVRWRSFLAVTNVIGAIADKWNAVMRGLRANLVFATGFKPETNFGERFSADGEFLCHFIMRDGFLRGVFCGGSFGW